MSDRFAAQSKVQPVNRTSSGGVLGARAGGGGRGDTSQEPRRWSLPARSNSTPAGQNDLHQGRAGKTQSHASRAEPAHTHGAHLLLQRGACSMAHPHPCWMRLLFTVTPKGAHSPAPQETSPARLSAEEKEGCGRAGESQGARCSSGSLWANTVAGHKPPSSPGSVYRSAWPSLGVITAKCTDNAINKHAADSRGANVTPNIKQLSLSL